MIASGGMDLSRHRGGRTRQLTTFDQATRKKAVNAPAGRTTTIGEVSGQGYIANLWMTVPGWFWAEWEPDKPRDAAILKTLIVKVYFDGADHPAIAAPIGDLFGVGLCEVPNFASAYLGMSSGGFFCRFPMPFRMGFRIEVENLHAVVEPDVFCNAVYQLTDVPDDSGYLHAQFCTGRRRGDETVTVADVAGRGDYVGCAMSLQAEPRQWLGYLESPEHVFIDGDDEPTIVGTGLEDYFMGGWYFREGPIIGPLHGVPVRDPFNSSVAMYRFHADDAIAFESSFRMDFVHPWPPDQVEPYAYSSVAFCYTDEPDGPSTPLPGREELLCFYRIRNRDHYHLA
ncbi:MAG: glycoside hydrolase family 172 protein [Streptosporangiales bacterium]